MKKTCYSLLLCGALVLTGCNNSMQNDTENPMQNETSSVTQASTQNETTTKQPSTTKAASDNSWKTILSSYNESSYDSIKSGDHKNDYAILTCIIDTVEYYKSGNCITCNAWFSHGDSYVCQTITFYIDELKEYSPKDIVSGDNLKICFYINKDNSFGSTIKGFIKMQNDVLLDDIYNTFKANCSPMEYADLLRYADTLRGETYSLNGEVLQIISEENNYVELLVICDNTNVVHVKYSYKDIDTKMLEGDEITVYGTFYSLFSYLTVSGTQQKVPSITAKFIENHTVESSNSIN